MLIEQYIAEANELVEGVSTTQWEEFLDKKKSAPSESDESKKTVVRDITEKERQLIQTVLSLTNECKKLMNPETDKISENDDTSKDPEYLKLLKKNLTVYVRSMLAAQFAIELHKKDLEAPAKISLNSDEKWIHEPLYKGANLYNHDKNITVDLGV